MLGAAWTDEQRLLTDALANVWTEHARWPTYQWVDHYLRRQRVDARQLLASFPTVGGHGTRVYADIAFDRSGWIPAESTVRLTIAGLARHAAPACVEFVDAFLVMLRDAALVERDTEIKPFVVTPLRLTSDRVQRRTGLPVHLVQSLYAVVSDEPVVGFGSRSQTPDGNWSIELEPGVSVYGLVDRVDEYLTIAHKSLAPQASPPRPPVLPSPVSLATAIDYLDVTWQLHSRQPLFAVTNVAGITSLAFDAGNEDEFRSRCSAFVDLLKTMRSPGLPGSGGHPLERLGAYLAAHLPSEEAIGGADAIAVLNAVRRIRVGQQHAHQTHDAFTALNELGIQGPPFDWTAAWVVIRDRATSALMDLRLAVARLPKMGPACVMPSVEQRETGDG